MGLFKNFFVPEESNNYKARLLHPTFLVLQLLFFLTFQLCLNFFLLVRPQVLGFSSSITPERIVELTNQKRTEEGLPSLRLNPVLSEAAGRKASDMFAFNYWAHTSPSGRDPWSFFREAGYNYLYAGENLARDFADPEGVVNAWMASSSHRDNILNGRYQEIGVAVVNGTLQGVETTLVTQLFGTPKLVFSQRPNLPPEAPAVQEEAIKEAPLPKEALLPPVVLVAGKEAPEAKAPLASPLAISKIAGLICLGFLAASFALELIYLRRREVVRLSGRNLAHAAFLGTIILLILLTHQGAIL